MVTVVKKLLVLFGVILIIGGGLLYYAAVIEYEDAMLEPLGYTRTVTNPFGTEEEHSHTREHENFAKTMKTGAFLCWAAAGVLLASGYLMKNRDRSPFRFTH